VSRIGDATIESFWPLAYFPNEAMLSGNWIFTDSRNVPESGETSLYLAISAIAFAAFGWRHLKVL
jgi:hypothetical protein